MCRSIKRLRIPGQPATEDEIRAAALQFVRKVSGFNKPSMANREAFDGAVDAVARAAADLLVRIEQRDRKTESTPCSMTSKTPV